ncbi:MAG: hypothetical protein ACREM6_12335 [Vulcanimicrobiaceae bacterium]
MNATPNQLAVIRTRLPYIDRRALSRAWFDALHLARATRNTPSCGRAPAQSTTERPVVVNPLPARTDRDRGVTPRDWVGQPGRERCSPALDCHKSVERAPRICRTSRREPTPVPASTVREQRRLTLEVGEARVHLLVRAANGRVDVIAVCSARHLETVRAALARTANDLRIAGRSVDASIRVDRRATAQR